MAYDENRGRPVLFGGADAIGSGLLLGDTWELAQSTAGIPAVSALGSGAMALLIVVAGVILIRRSAQQQAYPRGIPAQRAYADLPNPPPHKPDAAQADQPQQQPGRSRNRRRAHPECEVVEREANVHV